MAVTPSSGTINYEAFCAAPDCGAYRNIFVFCLNTELEAHIETFYACNKTETVEINLDKRFPNFGTCKPLHNLKSAVTSAFFLVGEGPRSRSYGRTEALRLIV